LNLSGTEGAYQNPRLDVGKSQLSAVQERLLLAVNPIVLANIFLETPCSQFLFFLSEPRSSTGEIGQDPNRDEGNGNGDSTLNNE